MVKYTVPFPNPIVTGDYGDLRKTIKVTAIQKLCSYWCNILFAFFSDHIHTICSFYQFTIMTPSILEVIQSRIIFTNLCEKDRSLYQI